MPPKVMRPLGLLIVSCLVALVVTWASACRVDGSPTASGVPSQLGELLSRASSNPVVAEHDGFDVSVGPRASDARRAFRSTAHTLWMHLPTTGDRASTVTWGEHEIGVKRRALGDALGHLEEGALFYGEPGRAVRSVVLADGSAIEEVFLVASPNAALGYDLDLPAGWSLRKTGAATRAEIVDEAGNAAIRISTDRAWDRDGEPVRVGIEPDAKGLRVVVASDARYPVAIDPTWVDAALPLKLRTQHTSTLLADGRVLVVGGLTSGVIDASSELYDPNASRSVVGPSLAEARGQHTATLLTDGRVLVTGGTGTGGPLATTEIYDPKAGTFSAGPAMSKPRRNHVATLLADGRVLVEGAGSAEIFDPATSTFVTTGQPTAGFTEGMVTARLADGRVLFVGNDGGPKAQLFDASANGGVGAFVDTGAPTALQPAGSTLTALRNGRVLLVGGCPCSTVGGPIFSSNAAELFNPAANGGVGAFTQTGNTVYARLGHTATLLPSGKVLLAGENDASPTPESSNAELFDPATGTFTAVVDPMNARRGGHTATLLPSGDVLLIGGLQAAAELYVGGGVAGTATFVASPDMNVGRAYHTGTSLADGRVLLAGGLLWPVQTPDAEVYDPVAHTFTATSAMVHVRRSHTATILRDGRVLLVGGQEEGTGVLGDAEVFDPQTNGFSATGSLKTARMNAAAVTLPSGKVLVVGGSNGSGRLDSAELFDPAAGTFTPSASTLPSPMGRPGAVLLPNGRVLVVGATSAALYDPVTDTFAATGSPGAVRPDANTLLGSDDDVMQMVVLPSGNAFVLGGATLAGETYDAQSGTFSFAGNGAQPRINHTMTMLPSGQTLVVGGNPIAIEPFATQSVQVFDPGGSAGGRFFSSVDGTPRSGHSSTILPDGDVLVAGGLACFAICPPTPFATTSRWSSFVSTSAFRPVVSQAPTTVAGGDTVTITGMRFRGPEASGGGANASATTVPIAVWQPLAHPTIVVGTLTQWTDTSAEWRVPATTYAGPGRLYVYVDGVPSAPVAVTITPAAAAIACSFDAECGTGHCADGVCCDTKCDGVCDGCTAARKGSGMDGVCGAVPPELDPNDACVVSPGGPCTDPKQCSTGFCVDGVCCQSSCANECEACDVSGSLGTCVPVKGLPHGGRPACEASPPADSCDAKICDGIDRNQCAGVVGPCIPFACGAESCLHTCMTSAECAAGYHCDGGNCVAGQCDGSKATTADGQVVDCAPYTCQPDGTCRTSCATVDDCAAPAACNFEARCVPRPPPDNTSNCGCTVADRGQGAGFGLVIAAALVAAAARRKKAVSACIAMAVGLGFGGAARADDAKVDPPQKAPVDESKKAEAMERFERGVALTAEQRWSPALAEFVESRRIYPTRSAAQNIAFCLMSLKRYDEALDAYEALLRDYPTMETAKQKEALKAIADLKPQVGTIEVDGAEPGATILVDGMQRGTYPTSAPIRVVAASHVVRVFKQGFQPFEQRVEVAGRGVGRVEAKLLALRESGTLKVSDASKRELSVLVDSVEVGKTPFEGALAVGKHVVVLKGDDGLGTPPTAAPIELGRTTTLELKAVKLDAKLRVEPTPAAALVTIDSVSVGRGTWEGALPSGTHRIEVSADGFLGVRRDVKLKASEAPVLPIALARDEDDARWKIPAKLAIEASGSFGLFPRYFGNVSEGCGKDCSIGPGIGALAMAHFTYELGSGLGFGLSGGYLFATQAIHGRTAPVRPVGLPERNGSISDTVSASGGVVAAHVSYHFGDRAPVLMRLAVGPWLGFVRDERVGSFSLNDGFTYQAGPAVQSPFSVFLTVSPEVRVFYRLTKKLEVSLGISTPLLIALKRPRWDSKKEVDAAVDGIGAFNGENLTGPVWFILAPGLGARYAF